MKPAVFHIGPYAIARGAALAPMAGVTDLPFRQLCRRLGATYAVSEMASSNPALAASAKTRLRLDHDGEDEPRVVQIVGADPHTMARAARDNVGAGAQIIDINMGCPARKVCRVAAGSALLEQEALAVSIVDSVARAVDVPVTVKLRTGPDPQRRNAGNLARAFESAGARMLVVHGRTRACAFRGQAEHDTVADIKARVRIPVIANGDIDSPRAAARVLHDSGADAVMIGRAARGRPWLFARIAHYLATGNDPGEPDDRTVWSTMKAHLIDHYALYGEARGVRSARKHVQWYLQARAAGVGDRGDETPPAARDASSVLRRFLEEFHGLGDAQAQLDAIDRWFDKRGTTNAADDPGARAGRYRSGPRFEWSTAP